MDELERAGRALRDAMSDDSVPHERVRVRARTLSRHRRLLAVGSVATTVVVVAAAVGLAARAGGVGGHATPAVPSATCTSTATTTLPPSETTYDIHTTAPDGTHGARVHGKLSFLDVPPVAAVDDQHLWRIAPVFSESVEYSADGGHTWQTRLRYAGRGNTVHGVIAFDARHAVVLAAANPNSLRNAFALLRTSDGGRHWTRLALRGVTSPLVSVSFADPEHGWAAAKDGSILTTADGGDRWCAAHRLRTANAIVVCAAGHGEGWAASSTALYRTTDNGATWTRQALVSRTSGGERPRLVCSGSHAAYSSFLGDVTNAEFVRTDDAGAHWRPVDVDGVPASPRATASGFPDRGYRGEPWSMTADGTVVATSDTARERAVVLATAGARSVVAHFDGTDTLPVDLLAAAAVDAKHAFVETQTTLSEAGGGNAVDVTPIAALYATTDGGHTWTRVWRGVTPAEGR